MSDGTNRSTGPFSWFVCMSNAAGLLVVDWWPDTPTWTHQSSPHQEMVWFSPLGRDSNWKLISVSVFAAFIYSCLSSSSQDINASRFVTGEKVKAADSASPAGKLQHFKVGGMDVGGGGVSFYSFAYHRLRREKDGWKEGNWTEKQSNLQKSPQDGWVNWKRKGMKRWGALELTLSQGGGLGGRTERTWSWSPGWYKPVL